MVTTTRKLRSLNIPRPIIVEADELGRPVAITISRRKHVVEAHHETWRIDDEWWRKSPISRIYWRISLDDGRVVDVYQDLVTGGWFRQSYG
jgi:hypothetical protein